MIASSWPLSGTFEEYRKNQVNFTIEKRPIDLKNVRILIYLKSNLPSSYGKQVESKLSGSQCNALIIDYIRLYVTSNSTEIFDNSTDKRASEICESISSEQDAKMFKEETNINFISIIFVCFALFVIILLVSLIISNYLLFKEKKRTNQAQIDGLYSDFDEIEDNFEKFENNNESNSNEYETVNYDKIEQDN